MRIAKPLIIFLLAFVLNQGGLFAEEQTERRQDELPQTGTQQSDRSEADEAAAKPRPRVQIAMVLDTSSSMSGLLDQARKHLWTVVNQFIDADLGGQKPLLEVALLEYGAGRLKADDGYTRLVVPLTDDLDQVFEEVMKLTAVGRAGGSLENAGQVIDLGVRELAWSESNKDLKCIFIAGNESFAQGTIDFRKACQDSIAKGVTVSTIYCGNHDEGIRLRWKEGADLADGTYLSINHNRIAAEVRTPQDAKLAELNTELNKTYLAYGAQDRRTISLARQLQQDASAASVDNLAERTRYKSSSLYRNEQWDLIDGIKSGKVKLAELKDDELPEDLKKLTPAKRTAHVEKLTKQRAVLQAEIMQLSEKRKAFMAELVAHPLAKNKTVRKREILFAAPAASAPAASGQTATRASKTLGQGLDKALIEALKQQASKKGIKLKE